MVIEKTLLNKQSYIKNEQNIKMLKQQLLRILECVLLLSDNYSELEINKSFTFKEIDFSKKILFLISKNFKPNSPYITIKNEHL